MARRKRRIKTNLKKSDIRRYFSGAYRYFIKKQGLVKVTSRKQPIIQKVAKNTFIVVSPFKALGNKIAFVFATRTTLENDSHYVLISAVSSKVRWKYIHLIKKKCSLGMYHKWLRYLKHLLIEYQVSTLDNGTYYIRISDYSIQSAYYRLIMFEIAYSHIIQFMLWN